jgi:hypothetical protein
MQMIEGCIETNLKHYVSELSGSGSYDGSMQIDSAHRHELNRPPGSSSEGDGASRQLAGFWREHMTIKSNLRSSGLLASTIAGTFMVAGAALPASAATLTTDMGGAQQSETAVTSTESGIILAQTTNFKSQFSDGNESNDSSSDDSSDDNGHEGSGDDSGHDGGDHDGGEGGSDGGGGEGGDD